LLVAVRGVGERSSVVREKSPQREGKRVLNEKERESSTRRKESLQREGKRVLNEKE
jgi:hypothetical protein